MPENQTIQITDAQRRDLARSLSAEISTALQAKSTLHDRIEEWNNLYEGVRPPKSEPWAGCSDLHIPMTNWQIGTLGSNLLATILGTDPIVRVDPRGGKGKEERARNWERWLQYQAARRLGIKGRLREVMPATLKHGTGVGKLTIDRSTRGVVGPRLAHVPLRQFVLIPAESRTVAGALGVGDRRYLRRDAIWRKEAAGTFRKGTTEALGDAPGVSPPETEMDEAQGIAVNKGTEKDFRQFEHWEVIRLLPLTETTRGLKYDPKKGVMRDCLIDLILGQGTGSGDGTSSGPEPILARCIIYPWLHGRRHYIDFRVRPREGQFYGESCVALLKDINDEIDTVHNQRLDWSSLVIKRPIILMRGARPTDAHGRTYIEFKPGAFVMMENPDDGKFMDIPDTPPSAYKDEAVLLDYGEQVLSVTQQRLGKTERGRKTLGEVEIVEALGNQRFDDMVQSFHGFSDFEDGCGLTELFYQLMGLSTQYAEPQEMMRVLGTDELIQFDRPESPEEIMGAYDFVPQGNSLNSNVQRRKEEAVLLYREMLQNPMVINNPLLLYQNTKLFLERYGEKEWEVMVGEEDVTVQAMLLQMAQKLGAGMQEQDAAEQVQQQATEEGAGVPAGG